MSITFTPTRGTHKAFTYYGSEGWEADAVNGCIRFESQEPSCNAHNSGAFQILRTFSITDAECCGTIPNNHLVAFEALLVYSWPEELGRYRDELLQVVRCAMYHNCDIDYA